MTIGVRRQSRELALQILFGQEFSSSGDLQKILETFRQTFAPQPEAWDYAGSLIHGVISNQEGIDQLIQKYATNWRIGRLALVDLILLRVATYEMRFSDGSVPPTVAINEAIDLAKRFGTSDSGKFVNGLLDQIMKAS
jgi:transcription antitermination protein NusB